MDSFKYINKKDGYINQKSPQYCFSKHLKITVLCAGHISYSSITLLLLLVVHHLCATAFIDQAL